MPDPLDAECCIDCHRLEMAGDEAQEEPLAKMEFTQWHYYTLDQGCAGLCAFEVEPIFLHNHYMERLNNALAENERYSGGYPKVLVPLFSWYWDSVPERVVHAIESGAHGVFKCTTPFDDLSLVFGKEGTQECTHFGIRPYRGYSVYSVPYDRNLPMLVMGKDDVSDSESDRDSVSNSIGSLRSEDAPTCFGCGHNEHICNRTNHISNHISNHIEYDCNYCIDEAISKLKMEREECLRNIELWEKALRLKMASRISYHRPPPPPQISRRTTPM